MEYHEIHIVCYGIYALLFKTQYLTTKTQLPGTVLRRTPCINTDLPLKLGIFLLLVEDLGTSLVGAGTGAGFAENLINLFWDHTTIGYTR